MEVNKKKLKEQEIRTLLITPALQQKGWAVSINMREEYYFTDGRVLVVGNQHSVAEGKKADYLLYHNGKPIAVVEAKDNKHTVGSGMQQAMDYALILDLKFAYSSNGDAFLEHDFITGKETEIKLAYIIHSGFISGYQNRYGDNLKPPTNVYHRMTA